MYIKSIRYGFANNSSSSHSIVFLGNSKENDYLIDNDFGWSYFTATSEQAKKEYCFATLLSQNKIVSYIPKTPLTEKTGWLNPFDSDDAIKKYKLEGHDSLYKSEHQNSIEFAKKISENMKWKFISENFTDVFGQELIEEWIKTENEDRWGIPSVDHQSVLSLPVNSDGSVQVDFAKNLFSILIKKNFAILGGNDNDEGEHELESKNTHSDDPTVMATVKALDILGRESDGSLCIYDSENDDFVLQNVYNGDKIRISFNSNQKTTKSSFPELVDLKITDYCNYGCVFCYQSSTKEGKHASLVNIEKTIKMLSNSGTMEIAIGGGEPTSHPNLLQILQTIKNHNMMACFTTKNFNMHESADFEDILKTTNSIAFSCNSIAEIEKVQLIKEAMLVVDTYPRPVVYIQMIPELMSDVNFDKALQYVSDKMFKTPVTLLGYKDFGFGESYKPKNKFANSEWIKTIKKYSNKNGIKFGIDSVLVSKWKQELINNNVDPLALVGEEGKFSCYLDAVNMTIHKSSFSKEAGIQLTGDEKNIKEQFSTF